MTYWTLDVELASKQEADQAIALLRAGLSGERVLYAIDPEQTLTWHLDRGSVEMMREALSAYAAGGGEVGGLLETCDEWLRRRDGEDS